MNAETETCSQSALFKPRKGDKGWADLLQDELWICDKVVEYLGEEDDNLILCWYSRLPVLEFENDYRLIARSDCIDLVICAGRCHQIVAEMHFADL